MLQYGHSSVYRGLLVPQGRGAKCRELMVLWNCIRLNCGAFHHTAVDVNVRRVPSWVDGLPTVRDLAGKGVGDSSLIFCCQNARS